MKINKKQAKELDRIATKSKDGKLYPSEIVKAATNPKSTLHGLFEWDDTKAATKYRLDQARSVIEVYVQKIDGLPTRAYVSVAQDRSSGGGYMKTSDAIEDNVTRELLIGQMKEDLRQVLKRYNYLRGIAPSLFEQVEAVLVPRLSVGGEDRLSA